MRNTVTKGKDLKELFDDFISYCEHTKRLRPETMRGYKATFHVFSTLVPEVVNTNSLTAEMLNEFFKRLHLRERIVGKNTPRVGVKISTARTYWNKLNVFVNWLRVKELIKVNPLPNSKPPYPTYEDRRALELGDIHKIISAVVGHSLNSLIMKRDMIMLHILLLCGLRKGELLALQVRDIDKVKRTLTVRGETSKSKRDRQVPMHHALMVQYEDYISERNKRHYKTEFLIVSSTRDKELSVDGLKNWVKRLNKKSGVKFHMHQFRHTFACALGKQNASAIKIQKLLGHTDPRMTQRYLRSMDVEDLRNEVNGLDIDNLV